MEQGTTRLPELLPIRYGRMVQSPFAFYRGAARVMAADPAGTPRSGLTVQNRIAISGYLGSSTAFETAIADFAETHAEVDEGDHRRLADAVSHGRIPARTRRLSRGITRRG